MRLVRKLFEFKMVFLAKIKQTLVLASPIVVGQLGVMLMGLADTIQVGQMKTGAAESLGASGMAGSIFFTIAVVGLICLQIVAPMISTAEAEGDYAGVGRLLRANIRVALFLSIITIGLIAVAGSFYDVFKQTEVNRALTLPYLALIAISVLPIFLFSAFKSFTDGLQKTSVAMYITLAALLFNIVFNHIFINGLGPIPAMGLFGAGIATLLARILMVASLAWYIFKQGRFEKYLFGGSFDETSSSMLILEDVSSLNDKHALDVELSLNGEHSLDDESSVIDGPYLDVESSLIDKSSSDLDYVSKSPWELERKILTIGVPSGMQGFFEIATFGMAVVMMGWISVSAQAAHIVAINMASLTYMMATGIAAAGGILVGTDIGERNREGIFTSGNAALLLSIVFMGFCALVFYFGRGILVRAYTEEQAVIDIAVTLVVWGAIFQLFDGIQAVSLGLLRGLQDVNIPTAITIFSYWGIGIPMSYYAGISLGIGAVGIWIGLTASLVCSSILLSWRFYARAKTVGL
jgi:multidrug resistance protein, MATE family